jgi:hypothetical protein
MKAWGYDTSALENADDIAARDRYARLKAERDSWWVSGRTGGCSEDPPFWLRRPSITQRGRLTEVEPEPVRSIIRPAR